MRNVEVDMRIDKRYQNDILTDSAASLVTEGLLGQSLRGHYSRLYRQAVEGK